MDKGLYKHTLDQIIKSQEFTNRQKRILSIGLFKVLIIGDSNSGKSTLVNALVEDEYLIESSTTSTNITTYIGYSPRFGLGAYFCNKKGNFQDVSKSEYRTMYKYKQEEIHNSNRNKLLDCFALINQRHCLSDIGVTFVDTIGTGINSFDMQNLQILIQEADVVIHVYDCIKSGNFTTGEISFLKQSLFPSLDKSNIPYSRIIFAPNKIDKAASITEIEKLLAIDLQNFARRSSKGWMELCNNISPISALYGRLAQVGFSNYESVLNISIRKELMKYEFNIMQNASLEKGDYKSELYKISKIGSLIEKIKRAIETIDLYYFQLDKQNCLTLYK